MNYFASQTRGYAGACSTTVGSIRWLKLSPKRLTATAERDSMDPKLNLGGKPGNKGL